MDGEARLEQIRTALKTGYNIYQKRDGYDDFGKNSC